MVCHPTRSAEEMRSRYNMSSKPHYLWGVKNSPDAVNGYDERPQKEIRFILPPFRSRGEGSPATDCPCNKLLNDTPGESQCSSRIVYRHSSIDGEGNGENLAGIMGGTHDPSTDLVLIGNR